MIELIVFGRLVTYFGVIDRLKVCLICSPMGGSDPFW